MVNKKYEVIIVGAGLGGLSTALTLGRCLIKCCVISEDHPGIVKNYKPYNFITYDGEYIKNILDKARSDVMNYPSIEIINDRVEDIHRNGELFEIQTSYHEVFIGTRVVFATGISYDIDSLNIEGLQATFGISSFNCPFCHGYEMQNKNISVVGDLNNDLSLIQILGRWTERITIFSNKSGALSASGYLIVEEGIRYISSNEGKINFIELESGKKIKCDAIFVSGLGKYCKEGLPKKLGLSMVYNETAKVKVYETDVYGRSPYIQGIYFVGDIRSGFSTLVGAAYEGSVLGMFITKDILGTSK